MNKFDNILGTICDLMTPEGNTITGYFYKSENNILFTGRIVASDFYKLFKQNLNSPHADTFSLVGFVNENAVYIEKASCSSVKSYDSKPDFMNINILPYEIILGSKQCNFPLIVKQISIVIPELNWFFAKNALISVWNPIKDGSLSTFDPIDIKVDFRNMSLLLSRFCKICENHSGLVFSNINEVIIAFQSPLPIMKAVRLLGCLRILLCFFADDYVALPNEIYFSTWKDINKDNDYVLADKTLWLNDTITSRSEKIHCPFRIQYSQISECFSFIWGKWYDFWCDSINQPIIELFLDVISQKAVGLNRFLNLCQALEVYSAQYRDKETKKLLEKEKVLGITSDKRVTLRIRLKDLFYLHQDVFPQENDNSQLIADIRNYYTHYDPKKRADLEVKFGDIRILASSYEGVLHFLLVATVYKKIGVPVNEIKDSIFNSESRFGVATERLFSITRPTV